MIVEIDLSPEKMVDNLKKDSLLLAVTKKEIIASIPSEFDTTAQYRSKTGL